MSKVKIEESWKLGAKYLGILFYLYHYILLFYIQVSFKILINKISKNFKTNTLRLKDLGNVAERG